MPKSVPARNDIYFFCALSTFQFPEATYFFFAFSRRVLPARVLVIVVRRDGLYVGLPVVDDKHPVNILFLLVLRDAP